MVISRHMPGKLRNARYLVELILAFIYFGIPWMTFNGHPLMRLDIPARKFHLLGNMYIPQEGYFLHLFLAVMGLSLFFFTSLIGRVWCGWACPQTVFTDFFDVIGRLILGKKYGKKDAPLIQTILLHVIWIVFSLVSGFHFVAYFAEPSEMLNEILSFKISPDAYYPYAIGFFAGLLYLDMSFVREQFCKFACPYARFQTVMMDADTFNVTYDYKRGEPRRQKKVKIGDCTACNMCLVVCPTGVDIREGLNVGCIACAKCVDACTVQMGKEGKKSLINYDSLGRIESNKKVRWFRPRTILYGILLLAVSIFSVILIYKRIPMYVRALPDRKILPMVIPGHLVRNFYEVRLINISYVDRKLSFELDSPSTGKSVNLRVGTEESGLLLKANSEQVIRLI
ncbi:MAG: cytochrome c oxidase accessory protein CcoG, partial [Leptospiraceae bacterium]|nr:cytochrome c oxidase accessory protein CcoG [Leptospiraceae bacterium]